MSNCCDISNPLIRDGVSQNQRQTPALSPDYIKVDERDLADFLVFAYQLAQQVNYYDLTNQLAGDWQGGFVNSTPVWIARISKTRSQLLNQTYKLQLEAFLHHHPSSPHLKPILLTWAQLLSQIQQWYQSLQPYTPLKSIIKGLVKTNLGEPLTRMQGFELAYTANTGEPQVTAADFLAHFATTFGLTLGAPIPDSTPLNGTSLQARSELDTVFQVLFQNYRQIIRVAPQYLT